MRIKLFLLAGAVFAIIGRVGGSRLRIKLGDEELISTDVNELEAVWRGSLAEKLEAKVMAAS